MDSYTIREVSGALRALESPSISIMNLIVVMVMSN